MGDFVRSNRNLRMPGWMSAWFFCLVLITQGWSAVEAQSYAQTLEVGYCHCDLDNYLVNVRTAVLENKPIPPMPTSAPSTASNGTSTTNGTGTNSTTTTGGSTTGSKNTTSTGTSGTSGTSGTTSTVAGTSSKTPTNNNNTTTTSSSGTNTANGATSTSTNPGATTTQTNSTGTTTTGTNAGNTTGTTQTSSNTTTTQTSSNTTTTKTHSNFSITTTAPLSSNLSTTTTTAAGATTTTGWATTSKVGKGVGNSGPTSSTTTAAPAGRKKRDVSVSEIDYSLIEDVQTLMETPVDYKFSPRVKRDTSASSAGTPLATETDPLYSFITKEVVYSGIKSASDSGIMYDENGKISNCSCLPGSLVKLTICLLNVKYTNDLANSATTKFKDISQTLMYNLNYIMYKGLISTANANLFRRISLKSYEKRSDGFTDAVLEVLLTKRVYQAEYQVKNAIEPSVRSGELGPFITDAEQCIDTVDITPPEPEVLSPLWYLKYLCFPIALVVLVVLVLFTCIGKKDAYYIRMW